MAETPATTTPEAAPLSPTASQGAALLYAETETPAAPAAAATGATEGATPDPAPVEEPAALIAPPAAAGSEEPSAKEPDKAPTGPAMESKEEAGSLTAASYEIALPENFQIDEGLLGEAKETFAKVGVPKEGAQALIDLYAKAAAAQNSASQAAWEAQDAAFRKELYSLPDFTGATRRDSETLIGRLIDEHGGDELRTVLYNAGLGNNPTIAKTFLGLAKLLSEGAPTHAGGPAPVGQNGRPLRGATPGQILYPDQ